VPVDGETAEHAVALGRDYLLPHAQAAFGLMGADARVEKARRLWEAVRRRCEDKEYSEDAPPRASRRDLHQWVRRQFERAEEVDPAIELLVDHYYLRPVEGGGAPGRGHRSPEDEVSPKALAAG